MAQAGLGSVVCGIATCICCFSRLTVDLSLYPFAMLKTWTALNVEKGKKQVIMLVTSNWRASSSQKARLLTTNRSIERALWLFNSPTFAVFFEHTSPTLNSIAAETPQPSSFDVFVLTRKYLPTELAFIDENPVGKLGIITLKNDIIGTNPLTPGCNPNLRPAG